MNPLKTQKTHFILALREYYLYVVEPIIAVVMLLPYPFSAMNNKSASMVMLVL